MAKDVGKDVVLITGAGSGLGREIAREYAKLGSSLVLWDINQKGLEGTKAIVEEEYGKLKEDAKNLTGRRTCSTYIVDVSDRYKVKEFAELVYRDLNDKNRAAPGQEGDRYVSVLVNNAGIYHGLLLTELKDDQIERIFKINVLAHFWTVRAFLPKMVEHECGHIVEIASMGGINGMIKQVDYCASKFAVVGFEESLSVELDYLGLGDKIHTTVVCPLFFASNLFTEFNVNSSNLMNSSFVAKETVMTMRANHSRILLPKLQAYLQSFIKPFISRKALIDSVYALGYDKAIQNIKGGAARII